MRKRLRHAPMGHPSASTTRVWWLLIVRVVPACGATTLLSSGGRSDHEKAPSARTHGPLFRIHHKSVVAPYRARLSSASV
jgi:hypothetical protein